MNQELLNTIMQNVASLPPSSQSNENRSENTIIQNSDDIKPKFSLDTIGQKSINILGFDLYFDDIIILVLILFLLQEEKKDYLLIGVLGLMFFDFSLDKIKNFEPLNKLLSNFT